MLKKHSFYMVATIILSCLLSHRSCMSMDSPAFGQANASPDLVILYTSDTQANVECKG